jgi:hypothetical protein
MEQRLNNGYIRDVYNTTHNIYSEVNEEPLYKTNNTQPLAGILEDTAMSDLFFSDMNKEALQKTIRYNIFKLTQKKIAYQSDISLMVIMRSMYLQYANSFVHKEDLVDNIKNLNERVVGYSVKNISENLQQHEGYLKKISNSQPVMDHPTYVNKPNNYTYDMGPSRGN